MSSVPWPPTEGDIAEFGQSIFQRLRANPDEDFNNTPLKRPKRLQHRHGRKDSTIFFFFLEAFCDISHRLGGIHPFCVFSDAFPGLKMWVTFACATANFLPPFIISIAVLENVPPGAGLQKRATFPH
jgi:hypothetical protein